MNVPKFYSKKTDELNRMIREIYSKNEADKMMIRCIIDDIDVLSGRK